MATVVRVPASPNPFKGVAKAAGTIIGSKFGQARARERSQYLLDSLEEFTNEELDPQLRERLVESGQVRDWDDLTNVLAMQRSQQQEAQVTRRTEEGLVTGKQSVPRGSRVGERLEGGGVVGKPIREQQRDRVNFYADKPDLSFVGIGEPTERPQGSITLEEHKQKYGTASQRKEGGEAFFQDKSSFEYAGFFPEGERPEGTLTRQEWETKYGDSEESKTDSQRAMDALIRARGLDPSDPAVLNAARVEIKEGNDIRRNIRENYGERFGETFSFGSDQRRNLFNRATEIADDFLWQAAEEGRVVTSDEVASASIKQAEQELGPPDQPDTSQQRERLEGERPTEEEPGAPEWLGNTLGIGGQEDIASTEDILRSSKSKVSSFEDSDSSRLEELLAFGQLIRAREFLTRKGLTPEEAREFVLWADDEEQVE